MEEVQVPEEQVGQADEEEVGEIAVAFYESRKGGKKIFLDGFDYYYHHTDNNGKEHYYCSGKSNHKCRGKLIWVEARNELHLRVGHVSHKKRDRVDLEIEMFKRGIYRTVEDYKCVKNRNLLSTRLAGLSAAAKTRLDEKKIHSIQTHMSREKRTLNIFDPESFEEISPVLLREVIDGNGERIFKEIINDPSPMVIFGTPSNLEILRHCAIWSIDATFKLVPIPWVFKQMLVIAGYCRGRFLPLVYVLMSRRTVEDYVRVFESIPMSEDVKVVLVDFEQALINSLKQMIENMQLNIKIKGCRFHFSKALLKRIKKMGFLQAYLGRDASENYFVHFLAQLMREHAIVDYRLELPEKHHEDHRYYDTVNSFYDYWELMFFFDDLMEFD
uniref:MULE transposase domain-containing protein n=1 Tax=Acrobeloides nanus TaxID=290746 RepID=A0A914C0N7_9BILA